MKRTLFVICSLVALCALMAAGGLVFFANEDSGGYATPAGRLNFSDSDIARLEAEANAGNSASAMDLYSYYEWGPGAPGGVPGREAQRWLEKAAESGSADAQESMVNQYMDAYLSHSPGARQNLERAAGLNWPKAKKEFDWVQKKELGEEAMNKGPSKP